MLRKIWYALVCSDIVRKMLHKVRPYEKMQGTTDKVFERAIERLENVISNPLYGSSQCFHKCMDALKDIRREYMSVPADYSKTRPLIGVVGEIYCRLDTFANGDVIRHVEELGGECWLSDVVEWIWYTNWEEQRNIEYAKKKISMENLIAQVKYFVTHMEEKRFYNVFKQEFLGYEEPKKIEVVLDYAEPYLKARTSLGEMALSVGKAVYLYNKGADGIIDISPFSCMNGIVSEAVYPLVSKDCDNLPIKSLYFDASANAGVERDLPIFMEMVKGYMKRKTKARQYPLYFNS
jgi:predicted nucleotide-binding protein (sugar kinase/HSP70/actin superfamily)